MILNERKTLCLEYLERLLSLTKILEVVACRNRKGAVGKRNKKTSLETDLLCFLCCPCCQLSAGWHCLPALNCPALPLMSTAEDIVNFPTYTSSYIGPHLQQKANLSRHPNIQPKPSAMFARWAQQLRTRGRRVSAGIRMAHQHPVELAQQAQRAAPDPAPAQEADQEQNGDTDTESDNAVRKEAAAVHDREMRLQKIARRRWNAAIKPRSPRFQKTLTMFREKLKGSSIEAVLDQFFTRHEQDLLIPADKRRNPALAWIQRNNRDRYRRLMRSPRFAIVQGYEATLELKLTMLYFGLPVSCIQIDPVDEFDCDTDTADDEAEVETEKRREEAAKKQNKLRWLNAYGNRHLGRDNLRSK
ncbi:hypothetical protein GE09DRAFT_10506 [Coniochaeta sp. 2T2.1]|nr:hypothetical protein GE09DRAFT_10506 [Coniochaeta sp. 2T2.1]